MKECREKIYKRKYEMDLDKDDYLVLNECMNLFQHSKRCKLTRKKWLEILYVNMTLLQNMLKISKDQTNALLMSIIRKWKWI